MFIKAPKGTRDILPGEIYKWQYMQEVITKLCRNFGYNEIRLPVFEHTELFQRGVGDTTDIVQKEMYTFRDKGDRSITLRPEGTAGVVRSYIENGMASMPHPIKLYYNITAYRHENVQKGRYREFNQFGVEVFGAPGPSVDVEVISIGEMMFKRLGLKNIQLNINSIGCPVCRGEYNKKLREFLSPLFKDLCYTCKERFEKNPLRIIDCKDDKCRLLVKDAPTQLDSLCLDCKEHFEGVRVGLDNLGINYQVDMNIVRGLDYYTRTVFEFVSSNVGTQGTICGGGRYDGLIQLFGGTMTPGIGFALGIERLLMEMESQEIEITRPNGVDIYLAPIGEQGEKFAEKLIFQLRDVGINAEKDLMYRSLKAQMKYADKLGAKYTVVIGENEIESNKAILRNMLTGEQKDVSLDSILSRFKSDFGCKNPF